MAEWWQDLITAGIQVLGSAGAASIANKGAKDAANASNAASDKQIQLARDIYNSNLALSRPFYQGSGNAFNMLSNIYGLPAQNFSAPQSSNAFGSNLSSNGSTLLSNLGAGQPVAGHTGGGGSNPFASIAGNLAGNFLGGPIGGAIGSTLGGLVRNGGDNWTTLATQAPAGYDYEAYMNQNPGLAAEWAKPDVQSLFNGNRDAYAYWHYNTFGPNGKNEGWVLNPLAGTNGTGGATTASNGSTTQPAGTTTQATPATSTTGSSDPLNLFWQSPYGQLAKNQFLTIDNPAIKGAYATQGKSLSGAQQKALADRGAAMGSNAFGNYVGGLKDIAGVANSATSSMQNANTQFQNTTSNAFQNIGNTNAAAATARNNNWANAFANGAQGVYDTGKGAGWWS